MYCVSSNFHHRGVFIGPWGSSTNLEKSVWCQVVASLGFGPLGTCVKYTPVMMMILTFGQLYFVIP
jgi:hypothetical protein